MKAASTWGFPSSLEGKYSLLALNFLRTHPPYSGDRCLRAQAWLAVGKQAYQPPQAKPRFPQGIERIPQLAVSTSNTLQIWLATEVPLSQGEATW